MTVEYRHILVDRTDGIVTITLNEPKHLNPWLIPMMEELSVEMDLIAANPDDRVVVFTGAGSAFSSGGDVRAMAGVEYPEPHWMQYGEGNARGLWNAPTMSAEERLELKTLSGTRFHKQVFYLDKPTISAVNGVAAGAGADLAFTCDFRVAAESARFIEVYIRRALVPLDGGAFWAPYLLPHAKAMEMLLLGDAMSAAEALQWGLVNKVVPDADLMGATMDLARRLGKQPPVAVQLIKHMVREIHTKDGYEEGWNLAEKAGAVTRHSRDHKEAVQAFLEKRQPTYTGS